MLSLSGVVLVASLQRIKVQHIDFANSSIGNVNKFGNIVLTSSIVHNFTAALCFLNFPHQKTLKKRSITIVSIAYTGASIDKSSATSGITIFWVCAIRREAKDS